MKDKEIMIPKGINPLKSDEIISGTGTNGYTQSLTLAVDDMFMMKK